MTARNRRRGAAAAAAPVLTHIANYSSTSDNTTYSFASCDIGADVSKLVIVVIMANDAGTGGGNMQTNSGTIAGSASTVHATTTAERYGCAVMSREVTGGTTATIEFTLATSAGRAAIGVYTLTGYTSATPVGTDANNRVGSATTSDVVMNVSAGGAIVLAGAVSLSGWTFAGVTEDYNVDVESGYYAVFASASDQAAATPATYGFSGSSAQVGSAGASWL